MSNVSEFSSYNASITPPTPQGGGGAASILKNPRIMLFAAVGAGLIIFIWLRNRNSSSGYPIGQPSGLPSASGATSGTPSSDAITNPPANTQAYDPEFRDVAGGTVACDNLIGCQFFPTPQGNSNAAGGTNTGQQPVPSTLPPSIVINLPPGPASVPGPSTVPPTTLPPIPVIAAKPTPKPIRAHPLPKQSIPTIFPVTAIHPLPSPNPVPTPTVPPSFSPGGAVLPLGSQQLSSTLTNASQEAINSLHVQPPPVRPPVPVTHVQHNVAKPKSPAVQPPHVKGGGPQTRRPV